MITANSGLQGTVSPLPICSREGYLYQYYLSRGARDGAVHKFSLGGTSETYRITTLVICP